MSQTRTFRMVSFMLMAAVICGRAAAAEIAKPASKPEVPAKAATPPKAGDPKGRALVRTTVGERSVELPPGFTVNRFAVPPDVESPVCLAVVPQGGTVYVGIDRNAAQGKEPNRGRIVRCRDTNADGTADEFVEVARVDSPRGLLAVPAAAGKGTDLFVMHPPHLSVYHDADDDGIAESSEILVRDLGLKAPADHATNGIRWGIDGWIYVAVGDFGFWDATGTDGRKLGLKGGGVVRVRPDGSELELVARGQRNIFDVAVSPRLDLFSLDNTNDGRGWNRRLSHVPHGGHMGYPSLFVNFSEEIVEPLADYGFGGATGSLFVEEPGLPREFSPGFFTSSGNEFMRHPLEPKGASFTAGRVLFFNLYQIIDVDIDARGTFYISTWNGGSFGPTPPGVGDVLRIAPPVADPPVALPQVPTTQSSLEELVAAVGSASHTCRLAAQRELLRRKATDAAEALLQLAASQAPLTARIAALFTFKQVRGAAGQPAIVALAADPVIREYALRALADRQGELADTPLEPFLEGLADRDPRVRLQAVRGLGRFANPGPGLPAAAIRAMLPLTYDPDPTVAHVAIDSLVQLEAVEACLAALDVGPLEARVAAGRVLQRLHLPAVIDGLEAWLARTKRPVADEATPGRLVALRTLCRLRSMEKPGRPAWGGNPDTSGPYFKPIDWQESARINRLLEQELAGADPMVAKPFIISLLRHKIDLQGMEERIVALAREDQEFRDLVVGVLAVGKRPFSQAVAELVVDAALRPGLGMEDRVAALRSLMTRVDQPGVFDPAFRGFTEIVTLADRDAPKAVSDLWTWFAKESKMTGHVDELVKRVGAEKPVDRELALATLAGIADAKAAAETKAAAARSVSEAWNSPALTVSLLRGMARAGFKSQAVQIRSRLNSPDQQVREAAVFAAAKLQLGDDKPEDPRKPRIATLPFEDLLARLDGTKGVPAAGKKLFERQGCVACHAVAANEPAKGPLLQGIGSRSKRAELAESILRPSAKVLPAFATQVFVTDDGKIYQGFVSREDNDEVEVRDAAGIPTVLRVEQIEERSKKDVSPMPQGLVDTLTVDQFASLLSYLESLEQ